MSAEPYGVSAAHTSVPQDTGLRADPYAAAHLVVAESYDEATRRLVNEASTLGAPVELMCGDGGAAVPGIPGSRFATDDAALSSLTLRLQEARTGLRLYVSGSERFVRLIVACATRAAMSEEEIVTQTAGSLSRRVICMHCKTTTDGVATSVVDCAGCGSPLLVYHHFSRRLSAYMGFRVDAEVPGEVPEAELLWP